MYLSAKATPLRTRLASLLVDLGHADPEFGKRLAAGTLMTHRGFYARPVQLYVFEHNRRPGEAPEAHTPRQTAHSLQSSRPH